MHTFGEPLLTYLHRESMLYAHSLHDFLVTHGIESYSGLPVDHIAVKAKDRTQYESLLSEILPLSKHIGVVTLDHREIATAELLQPFVLPGFGETTLVEILEPKPEKVGKTNVGFDHCELLIDNPGRVVEIAQAQDFSYKYEQKEVHEAIVFKINDKQQEVKFKNTPMSEVLRLEEVRDTLKWMK